MEQLTVTAFSCHSGQLGPGQKSPEDMSWICKSVDPTVGIQKPWVFSTASTTFDSKISFPEVTLLPQSSDPKPPLTAALNL